MRNKNQIEIDIIGLQNDLTKARENLADLRKQIVATNVEAVALRKEVDLLKDDIEKLRVTVQFLEKDMGYKIEKIISDISPIKKIFTVIGGMVLTAIVGYLLTLVIRNG